MRHRKAVGLKLNKSSSHRSAMLRNMVTSLFKYNCIRTTHAKAKALRGMADHMVTLAKRGDLHARRQALSVIREKEVVYKLFDEAAERFGAISGGYTRTVKVGWRPGDASPVSMIELVAGVAGEDKKKKKKKKGAAPRQGRKTPKPAGQKPVKPASQASAAEKTPEANTAPEAADGSGPKVSEKSE